MTSARKLISIQVSLCIYERKSWNVTTPSGSTSSFIEELWNLLELNEKRESLRISKDKLFYIFFLSSWRTGREIELNQLVEEGRIIGKIACRYRMYEICRGSSRRQNSKPFLLSGRFHLARSPQKPTRKGRVPPIIEQSNKGITQTQYRRCKYVNHFENFESINSLKWSIIYVQIILEDI